MTRRGLRHRTGERRISPRRRGGDLEEAVGFASGAGQDGDRVGGGGQSGGAADGVQEVGGVGFSDVVDDDDGEAAAGGELLELGEGFVVGLVAVLVAFLAADADEGVDDDAAGLVLVDVAFELGDAGSDGRPFGGDVEVRGQWGRDRSILERRRRGPSSREM